MSNYYLLSPAKIKVKDAQGRDIDLSAEDLLSTLDRTDNDGFFLDQAQLDGRFPIYHDISGILSEALKQNTDPFIHVLFEVDLSQKARREFSQAKKQARHPSNFAYRISSEDITTIRLASIYYYHNNPAHFPLHNDSFQERVSKWLIKNPTSFQKARSKFPKSSNVNKSALFNSFLLLMITFFAMGYIFAYSGITAAVTTSLIKLGLLHTSGHLAMQLAISTTISLLLWNACFITLFAGNKLLKMARDGINRFRNTKQTGEESELLLISPEVIAKLQGFESTKYQGFDDLDMYDDEAFTPPPIYAPAAANYAPIPPATGAQQAQQPPTPSLLQRLKFW